MGLSVLPIFSAAVLTHALQAGVQIPTGFLQQVIQQEDELINESRAALGEPPHTVYTMEKMTSGLDKLKEQRTEVEVIKQEDRLSVEADSGVACGPDTSCFTDEEQEYMQTHASDLKAGLETIQAEGCFPTGISIACLGYYRTGSTLLYNTVRAWAALAGTSATKLIAQWQCKPEDVVAVNETETSLVCKDHELNDDVAANATILLMSHRDVSESVCSRKMEDQWCRSPQNTNDGLDANWTANRSTAEYEQQRTECFANPVYEQKEAVDQCHRLMKMQADVYRKRQTANRTVAYDVLLSDYVLDPPDQIREVGKAMGICDAALLDPGLLDFVRFVGETLHDEPGKDTTTTLMHTVHTDEERAELCGNIDAYLLSDSHCYNWMVHSASPEENACLTDSKVYDSICA